MGHLVDAKGDVICYIYQRYIFYHYFFLENSEHYRDYFFILEIFSFAHTVLRKIPFYEE